MLKTSEGWVRRRNETEWVVEWHERQLAEKTKRKLDHETENVKAVTVQKPQTCLRKDRQKFSTAPSL